MTDRLQGRHCNYRLTELPFILNADRLPTLSLRRSEATVAIRKSLQCRQCRHRGMRIATSGICPPRNDETCDMVCT